MTFLCVLGDDVTGGHVNLNISLNGVHLLTESLDLCETLPQMNLDCPLEMGPHVASFSLNLPSLLPSVSQMHTPHTNALQLKHADPHTISALQLKHADPHTSALQLKHADPHTSALQLKHADPHTSALQAGPHIKFASEWAHTKRERGAIDIVATTPTIKGVVI